MAASFVTHHVAYVDTRPTGSETASAPPLAAGWENFPMLEAKVGVFAVFGNFGSSDPAAIQEAAIRHEIEKIAHLIH